MKINIFALGVVCLFFSCKHNVQIMELEDTLANPSIRKLDATVLDDFNPLISPRALFKEIEYLHLKTPDTLQLTFTSKILEFNNMLIVLDSKKRILLAFDLKGEYLGQVGIKGQGPGEYQGVWDFDIDYQKLQIVIFSRADGAIYWFDRDLNFLDKKRIDAWGNQLSILESGNIAIYSFMDNENDPYNIRIYDQSGNMVSKCMNFPQDKGEFSVPNYSGFIRGNYYSYPYSSAIYKIDEEQKNEYQVLDINFPNRRSEKEKFDYPVPSKNPAPQNQFLAKFEIGKENKELLFYYQFLHSQGYGYTLGISLADGQTFGHNQMYHGALGKLDIYVKLFFLGPYNLPTYNQNSGYYYIARNLGSLADFYEDIQNEMEELQKTDKKLYDILTQMEDIEDPFVMKFKLVDKYDKK